MTQLAALTAELDTLLAFESTCREQEREPTLRQISQKTADLNAVIKLVKQRNKKPTWSG
jgi:hypothetical protein